MPAIPSPRQGRRPRLEIVPFIDIMFFLLATFMMVSLSMVQGEGIDLVLPRAASTATPKQEPAVVTISLDAAGGLFWNRQPINQADLPGRLEHIKQSAPDTTLVILADARCDFGRVVGVFDSARQLGLVKWVVRTDKAD